IAPSAKLFADSQTLFASLTKVMAVEACSLHSLAKALASSKTLFIFKKVKRFYRASFKNGIALQDKTYTTHSMRQKLKIIIENEALTLIILQKYQNYFKVHYKNL
ncbi:hypothetical protein, partial [Bartonella fuyuanensis]|uniref:hypothetical protein n=1 Tax=Bartonella fuyuanensis TaxID=1460968 RepID=UPI0016064255